MPELDTTISGTVAEYADFILITVSRGIGGLGVCLPHGDVGVGDSALPISSGDNRSV